MNYWAIYFMLALFSVSSLFVVSILTIYFFVHSLIRLK